CARRNWDYLDYW
nr:immunoglobulin heavy chain junction region [Mus musculus]